MYQNWGGEITNSNIFNTFLIYHYRIEELGKLNYALDVALQQEREGRRQMQANLRLGDNLSMPGHILHSEHSRQSATPSPQ